MFSLFKAKNPYEQPAIAVYTAVMKQALRPVFYEKYQVPDTFTGRFDCLLLHIFLVMQPLVAAGKTQFNQTLFDITFADMDQTLREMGIGDMGVPKHQKKMMKAFNGRMHAYRAALDGGNMADALHKNLYGGAEGLDVETVQAMEKYVGDILKDLQAQSPDDIVSGQVSFKECE